MIADGVQRDRRGVGVDVRGPVEQEIGLDHARLGRQRQGEAQKRERPVASAERGDRRQLRLGCSPRRSRWPPGSRALAWRSRWRRRRPWRRTGRRRTTTSRAQSPSAAHIRGRGKQRDRGKEAGQKSDEKARSGRATASLSRASIATTLSSVLWLGLPHGRRAAPPRPRSGDELSHRRGRRPRRRRRLVRRAARRPRSRSSARAGAARA